MKPLQFNCKFVPHRGGTSSKPDLGAISILSDNGDQESPITFGSITAEIMDHAATFPKLNIDSGSVDINKVPTGSLSFSIISPAHGTFDEKGGHLSIQIHLDMLVQYNETSFKQGFTAGFQGQLETAQEGKALSGQIKTDSIFKLPMFGEVQIIIIRVFCVYR
jgi:hypothetical protein